MSKQPMQSVADLERTTKAELFLNRVLTYQAAIAVHQLKDDLGLDVQELHLAVSPAAHDAAGTYRVVCTIVRATTPEPVVLEVVVEPEKAISSRDLKAAD